MCSEFFFFGFLGAQEILCNIVEKRSFICVKGVFLDISVSICFCSAVSLYLSLANHVAVTVCKATSTSLFKSGYINRFCSSSYVLAREKVTRCNILSIFQLF